MTIPIDLTDKLDSITEIYIDTRENYRFCYNMHYSDNEVEHGFLSTDTHINFIRHSLFQLTVIDICKLYSTRASDKYDVEKLLVQLSSNGHYRKLFFDEQRINIWLQSIQSKRQIIANLNKKRDKLYAHTDRDRKDFAHINLYFRDILELLDLTEEILHQLNIEMNRPRLIHDSPYFLGQEFCVIKAFVSFPIIRPLQFRVSNTFINFKIYNHEEKIYRNPNRDCH